ncbi:MAG: glycosyltransferase family 2 protein, partial [Phycisphaeraceae bacterium]
VPIRQDLASDDPADFYLLLNPDTLVRPGAFTALLTFMAEHPDVGVAGSLLEFPDGSPQPTLHRAPTPWRALDDGARIGVLSRVLGNRCFPIIAENGTQPCEWVSGASMMVRRQVFEQVGLLDEGYFLYFDEVDFCMRVQKADWKIFCVVESRVMHLEGVSTGIGEARKRRARYWYESRRRFLLKFYGIKGLIMADTLWFTGKMLSVVRRMGWPEGDPTHFVRDLIGGDLRALSNGEARSLAYGKEACVEGTDVAERTRPERSSANL